MKEDEAYEKLQQILSLAVELVASGHYSEDEIIDEINSRLGAE